ncbi:T-cell surface glycoprotein CD3 delta chain-like isoform X2 [Anguilla rostrata]|uniref:T-cell surface glycoprotein CD3 delta chain-like isoform X2 n=1 Tax=Anguilla rostrata TaxID=7938 RepID=UPI0030CC57A4
MEGKRIVHLVYVMVMLTLAGNSQITTDDAGEGVKLTCKNAKKWIIGRKEILNQTEIVLEYKDDSSGEYTCQTDDDNVKILVKFRTCDNCVDLDVGTVAGIVVGEVIATALIGVAVYLLASQPQGKVYRQANKASDRQNLIQNQQNDSTYQPLSHGNASEYSQLEPRRGRKH